MLEVSVIVFAQGSVGTKYLGLVYVLPRIFSSEHIVNFLAFEFNFVLKPLFNLKYVGARFTEEAEVRKSFFCQ